MFAVKAASLMPAHNTRCTYGVPSTAPAVISAHGIQIGSVGSIAVRP